jgi:AraC family transcriptional regulator of adaptative response / DNA-3-methyladenine glycosylase II
MTTTAASGQTLDAERCYRAVASRDPRFDGQFYVAVTSTGIYCRPSCPARTPLRANVRFYVTSAAAQTDGFRACRRCRPEAVPGSPEWDIAADVSGRAMRLIGDGVVDRDGVPGLAQRLGYSERQLSRLLVGGLGAGPLALARARRAQTARTLVEATAMPLAEVAFAAGFASIRQFNATVQQVYGTAPGALRRQVAGAADPGASSARPGSIELRLACRAPFDGRALLHFLRLHAVPGVEELSGQLYRRTMRLPHGSGVLELSPDAGGRPAVLCSLRLADLRDVGVAVERCRRLADLDADPMAVHEVLASDDLLADDLARHPGLRVPGHPDGFELAIRAVLGQQVSLASARSLTARLIRDHGEPLPAGPDGALTHLFPTPEALAAADPAQLAGPRARGRTLVSLAAAVASGTVALDRGGDRADVTASLLALPGIGPWTAGYVAMRALGDPDVVLDGDVGLHAALSLRGPTARTALRSRAGRWRPWGSYACLYLWHRVLDARWPDSSSPSLPATGAAS